MRYFPIHIILKDISFIVWLAVLTDESVLTEGLGITEVIESPFSILLYALTISRGTIIINLILQSGLYFGLKRYFRFRSSLTLFSVGLALHVPTVLFWINCLRLELQDMIIVSTISLLFSGLIYFLLNKRGLFERITTHSTSHINRAEEE